MPRVPLQIRRNQDLTELRKRLNGVNLSELATASGVSRATIWRIRQGRGDPSNETVDLIWAGLEAIDEADRERSAR